MSKQIRDAMQMPPEEWQYEVGQYYSEAEKSRTTEIEVQGETFVIKENLWLNGSSDKWEPHWAVSVKFGISEDNRNTEDIIDALNHQRLVIAALKGLDYSFNQMLEEDVALFAKPPDKSGMEVSEHE